MRSTSRFPLLVACLCLSLASAVAKANTGVRCITSLEAKPTLSTIDRSQAGKPPVDKPRCPKAIAWRVPDGNDGALRQGLAATRRTTGRA